MDLKLTRTSFEMSGIYGQITRPDGSLFCVTLEHSYPGGTGPIIYAPKIPPGQYVCKRGMHLLEGHSIPFETFEITNVPGHTNCLVHVGNVGDDSSGCVLVGASRLNNMIVQSRITFDAFMQLQTGVGEFKLEVV